MPIQRKTRVERLGSSRDLSFFKLKKGKKKKPDRDQPGRFLTGNSIFFCVCVLQITGMSLGRVEIN